MNVYDAAGRDYDVDSFVRGTTRKAPTVFELEFGKYCLVRIRQDWLSLIFGW